MKRNKNIKDILCRGYPSEARVFEIVTKITFKLLLFFNMMSTYSDQFCLNLSPYYESTPTDKKSTIRLVSIYQHEKARVIREIVSVVVALGSGVCAVVKSACACWQSGCIGLAVNLTQTTSVEHNNQ